MKRSVYLFSLLLLLCQGLQAQSPDSLNKALAKFQGGSYLNQVNQQTSSLNSQLTSQSTKYLQNVSSEESRLKGRLQQADSVAAGSIFGNVGQRYSQLQSSVTSGTPTGVLGRVPTSYVPSLDSMKNTLLFLQANKDKINGLTGAQTQKLTAAIGNVQALESKLQVVDNLKTVLQQREQYLTQQLSKYGMAGQMGKMSQTVYYYKQQMADLKASLADPSKLQQKAVTVLSQLPAYRRFLAQHSYLSQLFGQPDSYNLTDSSMKGLQSRATVEKMIQQKSAFGASGGAGGSQQLSQQMQQAGSAVTALKSKLEGAGNSTAPSSPGFTPNGQKTKSILKRLVFGANLQFEPATTILPTLCDAGLSLGYRLNDKATIGGGVAVKMGLGDGLQHIQLSGQGVSLRSYIDWKLKKNISLTGGYEENYLSAFQSLQQLRGVTGWQKSGLVGISREYQISSKVKGKAQLLCDLLSFSQTPRSQPIVFRVGWSF
jgi:hypothetical protein